MFRIWWKALGYSWHGLKAACGSERAFKEEVILTAVLLPVALMLDVTLSLQLWLISSLLLVLIVELANTGIEAVVDLQTKEIHPLAKRAKDVGSAMVFIALIHAAIVWSCILWSIFE